MNDMEKRINSIIMREIGLEVGSCNRIYDQDTGAQLQIDGMGIVQPGSYCGHQDVVFDPYNDKKMMSKLFCYFAQKQADETGVGVTAFYNVGRGQDMHVECRLSNNEILKSRPYYRDSLKYTDLIMQMNGDQPEDLSEFDQLPDNKNGVKRRNSNRGGKK